MADAQRVEIGFDGGQVVAVAARRGGAEGPAHGSSSSGGWHDLETEDGDVALDLGKVAFVRVDSGDAQGRLRRSAT